MKRWAVGMRWVRPDKVGQATSQRGAEPVCVVISSTRMPTTPLSFDDARPNMMMGVPRRRLGERCA